MSYVYEQAARRIMEWFHQAERDLIGKAIVRASGQAGVVKAIKLDEHHGLCFTLDDALSNLRPEPGAQAAVFEPQFYPVSTIRSKL